MMLFTILAILQIMSNYDVLGLDLEPRFAKSTQSYYRGDVPLAYHFNAVHVYSTAPTEDKPAFAKKIEIQYAPLGSTSDSHKHTYHPHRTTEPTTVEAQEEQVYKTLTERDHLEPKWVTEDIPRHGQKTRSFYLGHNIEMHQSDKTHGLNHGLNNLHGSYHNHVDHPKIKARDYSTFQKHLGGPEEQPLSDGLTVLYIPGTIEQIPIQKPVSFIKKPVPLVLTKPVGTLERTVGAIQRPSSINKVQLNPTGIRTPSILTAFSAFAPGIHLNLARVYGVAQTHDQAHINLHENNRLKAPLHTEAIFIPMRGISEKKTILYPVPDYSKIYPVLP